jgi:uncharacterized protein with NRDE domain
MCTIVALHRVHPKYSLLVAANRDEMYARATSGPGVLLESPTSSWSGAGAPRAIGGRDLEKGGTWLGATRDGFLVAVTNQRSYGSRDDSLKSRGQLVIDLLATGSVRAARELLERTDAREYNAFNLLFGDGESLLVGYARREAEAVAIEELAPGKTWILANDKIGSSEFPKTKRAAELAAPLSALDFPELATQARAMLADHEKPPIDEVPVPPNSRFPRELLRELQALCIHTPAYGTRSSSLVAIGDHRVHRYLFADGPPCTTAFEDVTALLE